MYIKIISQLFKHLKTYTNKLYCSYLKTNLISEDYFSPEVESSLVITNLITFEHGNLNRKI